jgi:microcystin-dependent protein
MAQPYVGEIRIFAGNFAPAGWMFCDGALLAISEYETLFTLIGTTYGGDGESTFGLPDLRGRVPIHQGTGGGTTYTLAENGGVESVTLTTQQIPSHTHAVAACTTGQTQSPVNAYMANASSTQTGVRTYSSQAATTTLNPATVSPVGGSQPHDNRQPYLGVNFIISLFGIFPPPS